MNVAELVARARNEDLPIADQHAAFAELVRRFDASATGWALQRLDDAEEAKDVAQDAFITAWLKLRQLREPAAFGAWLKRLIATQCHRRRRKIRDVESLPHHDATFEYRELLASSISKLADAEYRCVVLFYFLGRKLDEIARILGIPRGTVGKRLHQARIAIRRQLPRSVREEFVRWQKVQERLFDEYAGEYRFDERPDLVVRIQREGSQLVSYGGGQRSVLASIGEGALVSTAYDGEGRFHRDGTGRITQFIYYEFGERLGIAKKVHAPA